MQVHGVDNRDEHKERTRPSNYAWLGIRSRALARLRYRYFGGKFYSMRLSILAGIGQKSTGSKDETKILHGGQNFFGLPLPVQSIFMR